MISYERQKAVLDYLKVKKCATIKELAKIVWSSESTVRRDIKELERKGAVNQTYGGVILAEYKNSVVPLSLRDSSNCMVKEELAKKAAEYVFDGATVFMDGSSTVRRIIKYITERKNVKIITNNRQVFEDCTNPDIKLYCTGGRFMPHNNIFVGSMAEKFVGEMYADILFFSSQAISENGEISDASEEETSLRKVMIERSAKKIFLCDFEKVGQKRAFQLCRKEDIDAIICDKKLPWEG